MNLCSYFKASVIKSSSYHMKAIFLKIFKTAILVLSSGSVKYLMNRKYIFPSFINFLPSSCEVILAKIFARIHLRSAFDSKKA